MKNAIAIIIVFLLVVLVFYSLYRRGQRLSRDKNYLPKPGTFDSKRDAEWRKKYDQD
ncbi:MAG TPA: hypothetical protein VND43_00520 [Burkholderiales bacterium]|nr:hypothetical protein [Pseudomonadota bacterium]HVC48639.1 hypothetical protein [Burkholderiales bacterium]